MGWDLKLAKIWTKMVGPSRPTISELCVYTKYAHCLLEHKKKRLKLLVLGSTPEFRDWGFEENMEVTVVDFSEDYHNAINREIRHKSMTENGRGKENIIFSKWQDIKSLNEYDIIIGDLVIGNLKPEELDGFFKTIATALTSDGLFLGKSFFVPHDYVKKTPKELVLDYYEGAPYHPYSSLVFGLTMYCIDENNMLSFDVQYQELLKLYESKILKEETFAFFNDVGWNEEMKFKFYCPFIENYEKLVNKYLKIVSVEYGLDIYSKDFPLYIITQKKSRIYGNKKY